MNEIFDYIIVGAGSAGCVLANRLSEDPRNSVLVVEAGGLDDSMFITMPKGIGKLYETEKHCYFYDVRRGADQNLGSEVWMRGRGLGGSSNINGLMYQRGHPDDYDEWERNLGLTGWGWSGMCPIFRAIEDHELGANEHRGAGGPLRVSVNSSRSPLMDRMIAAGAALGLDRVSDTNLPDHEGIGYVNVTTRLGRRWSAADAFLHPVRNRPNLKVLTGVGVGRILFDKRRARTIACRQNGRIVHFDARREIILTAGALESPKLLQLSGIGPAELLKHNGITVLQDSENVGENMREHLVFRIQFKLKDHSGQNRDHRGWRLFMHTARYVLTKTGVMSAPPYDVTAFVRVLPAARRPDCQIFIGRTSMDLSVTPGQFSVKVKTEKQPGGSMIAYGLRPLSRGRVRITSADPLAPAEITANYLVEPEDREVAIGVFRYMRLLLKQPALRDVVGEETAPGPAVESDAQILQAFRTSGGPGYHAVGTCRMGIDDASVVDERLRVRGVSGLRVADLSVLPSMVSGNTNGPAMAVAWKAADMILEDMCVHA